MSLILLSRPNKKQHNIFVSFTYKSLFCKYVIKTQYGLRFFIFKIKNVLPIQNSELVWVVNKQAFVKAVSRFRNSLFDFFFGWFVKFRTIGYHYTARLYYRRKQRNRLREAFVLFRLGFFYRVLIKFPTSVKIFWRKRFFTLRGTNFNELFLLSNYIRFVRNLFPYKSKGFTFEDENFFLKTGKKSKFR